MSSMEHVPLATRLRARRMSTVLPTRAGAPLADTAMTLRRMRKTRTHTAVLGKVSEVERARVRKQAGSEVVDDWKAVAAYRLDYFFATFPSSKYLLLAVVTAVLIVVGGLLYYVAAWDRSLSEALWMSWVMVADPGTHAEENGLGPRAVGVALTLGGMLFFALLVGLIGDGIAQKMESLKEGRSAVVESGHSLILGWTPNIVPMIVQIALANESEGGGTVVIMAAMPKEEMDTMLMEELSPEMLRGTRVVTRSGSPIDVYDLRKCSVPTARSIVVLSPGGSADEADAQVVRSCLALASSPSLSGHVVVELSDVDNLDIVKLAMSSSSVEVIPVVAHDIMGRIMIQCSREPGLASIFAHLLEFDRNELYVQVWPQLEGVSFAAVLAAFDGAVPVGIKYGNSRAGKSPLVMLPPSDYVLQTGDAVVVIAEDNDSYTLRPRSAWALPGSPSPALDAPEPPHPAEHVLFCGWRRDVEDMIVELDQWVAPGSSLTVLSPLTLAERHEATRDGVIPSTTNMNLYHVTGNPIARSQLEALPLEHFDVVMVLGGDNAGAPSSGMASDSQTMVTMLLVRDIQTKRGNPDSVIVSEILDPRTTSVLHIIAEQSVMADIVDALFTAEGPEIHIKHMWLYADDGETLSFYQLTSRALARGHILIGYRRPDTDPDPVLNPLDKSTPIVWHKDDYVVVISED
ncbi:DMI1 protein [Thecamonas trahens ATCC 50062]|uniref:DMI1 protein n=1 Tax=Thecamonas trahens ATCC 50062 TaxID=461836 RepID=A0A0L0DVJ0_THETB|nr:DMI1 protein [Thecamonas trahens ATCC 50062]KNC56240.1 DMI1 protein [Thecamonas trahens ATCC 50062]|eukprot:XP_013760762.1 DMI1 protein [Thecamonas trahens ATCC 50062]